MAAQTPINTIIFGKSVMRSFRSIHERTLTDLGFLLRSFLDNLRTITQEGNVQSR